MTKVSYGDDYYYAASRLKNSIVRVGGMPVYVHNINEDCIVWYTRLGGNGESSDHLEDFDLSPVPLGNVNEGGKCSYTFRSPSRYYKQGLTKEVFRSKFFPVNLFSEAVSKTIRGIYPNIKDCFELLMCGESNHIAFSRSFSLNHAGDKEVWLLYRGELAGLAYWNNLGHNINYKLNNNRTYLLETLEDLTNV